MAKFAMNLVDDGLMGQQVFAGEATRLAYMTDEAIEGRDAFLEKREPDWSAFPGTSRERGGADAMTGLDDPDLVLRFWKPYDCLTAFTDRDGRQTLADHIDVPNVYPAGRLDRDSEGLLLLPRNKALRGDLTDATIGHPRTYLVHVEGIPSDDALHHLATGVDLKDGRTRPATRSSSLQNRRSRLDQYRSAFASRFLIPGFVSRSPKARIARYVE